MTNTAKRIDHHCKVRQERNLVSKMTECDFSQKNHKNRLDCYERATRESRENDACIR